MAAVERWSRIIGRTFQAVGCTSSSSELCGDDADFKIRGVSFIKTRGFKIFWNFPCLLNFANTPAKILPTPILPPSEVSQCPGKLWPQNFVSPSHHRPHRLSFLSIIHWIILQGQKKNKDTLRVVEAWALTAGGKTQGNGITKGKELITRLGSRKEVG